MSAKQSVTSFELPGETLGVLTIDVPVSATEGTIANARCGRIILNVGPDNNNGRHQRTIQIVRNRARPTKLPNLDQVVKLGKFHRKCSDYCIFMDTSHAVD